MTFICHCRSKLDPLTAHALELKRHDFAVELEAETEAAAMTLFRKEYVEQLDISDATVEIWVNPK